MPKIAIVGAGVSGLTCAVALVERGHQVTIFTDKPTEKTTSAVAAAIWFPYDAKPKELVDQWALVSYGRFLELARDPDTGVSVVPFEVSEAIPVEPPSWATIIGYRRLSESSYSILVPLMDTKRYLPYLQRRSAPAQLFLRQFEKLVDVPNEFDVIVNCSGLGAASLVDDMTVVAHRGQVVVVEKIPGAPAFVHEDNNAPPTEKLTYVIPRGDDTVFGGVNTESEEDHSASIVARCTKMLGLRAAPRIIESKTGKRPFRETIRIEKGRLSDGRAVVHNYGHGGCGLSLSWGCAQKVVALVEGL